jgi:hypothetical protein
MMVAMNRLAGAKTPPRTSGVSGDGVATTTTTTTTPRPLLSPWPVAIPADWIARVNRPQRAAEVAVLQLSLKRGRPLGELAWQRRTADQLALTHTFRARGRPKRLKTNTEK